MKASFGRVVFYRQYYWLCSLLEDLIDSLQKKNVFGHLDDVLQVVQLQHEEGNELPNESKILDQKIDIEVTFIVVLSIYLYSLIQEVSVAMCVTLFRLIVGTNLQNLSNTFH